jgi:hypothetical protein
MIRGNERKDFMWIRCVTGGASEEVKEVEEVKEKKGGNLTPSSERRRKGRG